MRIVKLLVALILVAGPLAWPRSLYACPSWQDAIEASGAEDEGNQRNLPAAFNASIYLMVGVPYASLGVFGFLVYRGCKKNAEYRASLQAGATPTESTLRPE